MALYVARNIKRHSGPVPKKCYLPLTVAFVIEYLMPCFLVFDFVCFY